MRCFCTKTKTYHCKVVLLDDQELLQEILNTSRGQDVLDTVFRHLNLIETSYFGLRYLDCANQTHWLDTTKKIVKQLKGKDSFTLYFGVKFYAADPCKLVEEITRYQFFLQVKQDILQGRLPVALDLLAELGAYAVQSELGDYDSRRHSPGYVSEFRFVSNQSVELEHKIAELHKELLGQLPAVAELNYLDKVKWLEMYGVDLHPVIGEDNVEYFLGLTPNGVIVLRNKSKVQSYYWSRIKKIYFKGKYFMLRVDEKNNDENTYGFETPSRAACKHLYKCCREHHSFFQLVHVSTNTPDVINTRFSSNRVDKLSGRSSQLGMRNPPTFVRTPSRRYQKRVVDGVTEDAKIVDEKLLMTENTPPLDDSKNTTSNSFYNNRSDSPRSTRSAPWNVWSTSAPPRPQHSSHSPRSVRSAGPQLRLTHAHRSSSVESRSSTDSRPCRRHKHRSKRGSDNESELSRCSSHGHGSHRRHRHRSRRSSGSEQQEHRSHSSHNRYQLIDSEGQWKEVQRRQAEGSSGVQEATVIRPGSGYINSGIETESEHSTCHHHRRKHRKHRSRSRSPSESGKAYLPDELKKHLEFQLVDTDGMSQDQLREIPYTVVKTNAAKAVRVRLSATGKPKLHASRRAKNEDSPPPPYSESPVLSDLSNKTTSTNTTVATATSDNIKHITRMPSHMSKSNGALQRGSCSALYNSSSSLSPTAAAAAAPLTYSNYPSQSNLSGKDSTDKNAWLSENVKFSNLGFVVGLPPQPHNRRTFNHTSHSDLALNTSKSQSPKAWPNSEIRGTVGLPPPWPSSLADQVQSSSVSSWYGSTTHQSGGALPRRSTNTPTSAVVDYNHLNQNANPNPLPPEPRLVNGNSNTNALLTSNNSGNGGGGGGGVYRGGNSKAGPQSAVSSSTSLSSSVPTARVVVDNNNSSSSSSNSEKFKKSNTLAESGVLGSHTNTPNGKVAWPSDRQGGQGGWPPKQPVNLNQMWYSNGNWSPGGGGGVGEYSPWSAGVTTTTTTTNGLVGPTACSPNWLPQQQPLPPPPPPPPTQPQMQSQPPQMGYRMTDRGMMYSSQPQMQRINENITEETLAEHPFDYVNCVNNNGRLVVSPNSPNNNLQFCCKTSFCQPMDSRLTRVNGYGSDGALHMSLDSKSTHHRLSPSDDKNNNNGNQQKSSTRNMNMNKCAAQNFIQEVSTEL